MNGKKVLLGRYWSQPSLVFGHVATLLAARRKERRTPRQKNEPVLPAFKNWPSRRAGVPPAPYGVYRMALRCGLVFNGGKQISTTI